MQPPVITRTGLSAATEGAFPVFPVLAPAAVDGIESEEDILLEIKRTRSENWRVGNESCLSGHSCSDSDRRLHKS